MIGFVWMTLRLKMFQHFTSCLWSQSPFIYFYYILKSLHLFESVTAASCGIDLFAVLYCAGLKVNQQTLAQENWQDGVVLNTGQCLLFLSRLPNLPNIFQDCSWSGPWFSIAFSAESLSSNISLLNWVQMSCHTMSHKCHEHHSFLRVLWGRPLYLDVYKWFYI